MTHNAAARPVPGVASHNGVRVIPGRLDPELLTPPMPWEFRDLVDEGCCDSHDGVAEGVQPVGRPGKVGVVDLCLGPGVAIPGDDRVPTARTGVLSRFVKAPMQFAHPLYIDPGDPSEAFIYVRSTGGGLAQNDRVRQRFQFGPGARAVVTTPAGTPVHRMNAGLATQWVSLNVGDDAFCEYLPGQVILFAGSRLVQSTDVILAESATLLAAEVILTGRLARGERDLFDAVGQCWRVERAGRPLLSDTLCVRGVGAGNSEMLLGRWPVWGTVLVVPPMEVGRSWVRGMLAEVRRLLTDAAEGMALNAAASTMVGDGGIMVRVAGEDPIEVRGVVDAAYSLVRERTLGRPSVDLRRM